jgi:Flp pilus assembly pilin Flp
MRNFLFDEAGATTARFTLLASCILMLIYAFFHTAGVMLHDMTSLVTSTMGSAVRRMTGGTLGV